MRQIKSRQTENSLRLYKLRGKLVPIIIQSIAMDEETPLLASINPHLIEAPRNRNLKSQFLGSTLALLVRLQKGTYFKWEYVTTTFDLLLQAAFLFAWNAFFVKEFHQDFVDVIFVRSLIQIVIFGGLTWKKSISFLPNRIEYETSCQYGLKCFLMIFQVSLLSK